MTSIYLELRPDLPAPPFQGYCNLDLEPRACALGLKFISFRVSM